ncbi:unnamed protein product [Polarella glacialis]|uniref:RRM domain-containing protein n=1 Tax=Polarella glacialis TaxID=89957 RepID=A0A813GWX3_POLGL|nr:unnamed protein product [Polarella glacialis]CAE8721022.1 unnamed protein product [Polarella glacialis]
MSQNINATKNVSELELKEGLEGSRSWHYQYRHSAYIYIGGLHPGLSEGDIAIVFAQFGEIVDVNMVRDRATGKSKGFCFICYEDQRATNLAVDNMNGFQLLKKALRVDHCDKFKAPKEFDEIDLDEAGDPKLLEYHATGAEGKGHQVYNILDSQKKMTDANEDKKKHLAKRIAQAAPEDADEAWAKQFEGTVKDESAQETARKQLKKLKKDKTELKKMKKEAKRVKKEMKQAKKEAKAKKAKKGQEKSGKKAAKSESSDSSGSSSEDSDS